MGRKTGGTRATGTPPAAGRPPGAGPWPTAALLAAFAVIFATLAIIPAADRSATWDEPIHLTAGYAAARHNDFRVDPSHPPLLRAWAALPLMLQDGIRFDVSRIDGAEPPGWLQAAYGFAHRFLYVENDADRLLQPARLMIVLLGIALGALVFLWAREWLGLVPAVGALILFALEPNILAHASLVTTDLGLTTFLFAAVYFLWRSCERPTRAHAAAAAVCAGLAAASKFSAVLLAPIATVLLLLAVLRGRISIRFASAVAALMFVAAAAAIWASYGFRYLPSDSPGWRLDLAATAIVSERPRLAAAASWVDAHRLLPNAYTQGFLYTQTSAEGMPSFLAGERSAEGWWYYFPAAFVMKTPLALLVLSAAGVVLVLGRMTAALPMAGLFAVVAPLVFMAAAMASGINLGVRHILPVYPFAILLAAAGVKALMEARTKVATAIVAVLLVAGVAELAHAYPYPLAFFNLVVGGPAEGYRYLADSNLGWGGNLERLKGWMDREGVQHVNLAYFGQADPSYYRIDATHLPGAPGFATDRIARPKLPGYVAISPTIMHGVYAPPQWQLFYQPFVDRPPAAVIGNSLRVYWVEEWPVAATAHVTGDAVEARRALADALLFGMQWPDQAAAHYELYLQRHPGDAGALMHLGIALVGAGRTADAMAALRDAVDADPAHGPARLTLARALFGSGDLSGASTHGREAVRLLPDNADAHDFLGRVLAAHGRFDDAGRHFHRALEIDPSHLEARDHAAKLARMR